MIAAARLRLLAIALAALGFVGCSHADYTPLTVPIGSPTPTPVPGTSATPTARPSIVPETCGTAIPAAVKIAVGSYIEPAQPADATYGTTYGYAVANPDGTYPLVSSPISLRAGDVVQFVNVDPPGPNDNAGTPHSAAGLDSASFPSDHQFPASDDAEVNATFSDSVDWSTGEIPASAIDPLCYSQAFTVPPSGTYYFGDLDFYNTTSMRDVIVVSASASQ